MGRGEHLGELEELVLLAVLRLGEEAYGASLRRELQGLELADEIRYPLEIAAADVREVRRIKARVESERLPACGQDPHGTTGGTNLGHELRARLELMLTVVQDEQ